MKTFAKSCFLSALAGVTTAGLSGIVVAQETDDAPRLVDSYSEARLKNPTAPRASGI